MNRKLLLTGGFVLSVVVLGAVTSFTMLSESKYTDHGGVSWRTNPDRAMDRAADEGTPVLVYLWLDGCGSCEDFEARLAEKGPPKALDEFVLAESEAGTSGLMERYDVSATPALVVVTPDGTKVAVIHPTETDDLGARLEEAYDRAKAAMEENNG